jgi:hypothetical protein
MTWQKLLNAAVLLLAMSLQAVVGLKYDAAYEAFNLNQNKTAEDPLDYWGQRDNHVYNPSPTNWRFPFYTLFLDRFVNGDPTNDNANGTSFEQDIMSTLLRYGGDLRGLVDTLDYIQGMGIKVFLPSHYFQVTSSDVERRYLTEIRPFILPASHSSTSRGLQIRTR